MSKQPKIDSEQLKEKWPKGLAPWDLTYNIAIFGLPLVIGYFLYVGHFFRSLEPLRLKPVAELSLTNFLGGLMSVVLSPVGIVYLMSVVAVQYIRCPHCRERVIRPSRKLVPIGGELTCSKCQKHFLVPGHPWTA